MFTLKRRSLTNNLSLHLNEKQKEQSTLKVGRRKKIIIIREVINEIENREKNQ